MQNAFLIRLKRCMWYLISFSVAGVTPLMCLVWLGPEQLLSSLLPVCLSATKLAHRADL